MMDKMARAKSYARLAVAAGLLAVFLAAYANHFQNGFQFDDAHTVVNNTAIRSLGNIPLFFRDAASFSSLPSNQSYRPLVSTLLAIDYSLGHGLHPFWFHISIFSIFAALVLLLSFVLHRLLETAAPSPWNGWIALLAAAAYGLHPANADTVNYIIASADVISTLGVIASFAVYFAFPQWRRSYLFVLPAALCVLAKPPAAIFAVLFAIYCLLFLSNEPHLREARLKRRIFAWCSEVIPPLLICAAMLGFVQHMTPHTWVAGAANSHHYLITQPYVILQYFKTFFWPSGISADYDLNPFGTTDDARFWIGFVFTLIFAAAAIVFSVFKRTRMIGFGLLWFLIALLPTSLFPLAEVMNDHRTFLPYIGLFMALAGAVSLLRQRFSGRVAFVKIASIGAAALVLCASAYATFQRNKVWQSDEALWRDVSIKSPKNGRGLMNYGNTLMAKGDFAGALDYYHRAQVLTPQYSFLLINLAIAEDGTHQTEIAEQHFRDALRLAPSSPDGYAYYARFLIDHARPDQARPLLERALTLSPSDALARDLLAQLHSPTPESLVALSLEHYREKRYVDCIAAGRAALALRPDYAEAWNNIGAAYNQLGQFEEAIAACEQAVHYKPDFELARNNLQYAREQLQRSGK
jgi:Flp pilus assembly protein TadD